MAQKRIFVVVNKWWECDPVMNVLLHANATPPDLGWPTLINHPRRRPDQKAPPSVNPVVAPRAVFETPQLWISVWCISDLLEDLPNYQSSSEKKMERLPGIFRSGKPDLILAVGTAGYPSQQSENGSVVVGTKVFIHNPKKAGENKISDWTQGPFDQLIPSSINKEFFDELLSMGGNASKVIDRFLVPPLNAVAKGSLLADFNYTSLGTVNVTDYHEYAVTDVETVAAFNESNEPSNARSLETTHGLIRVCSDDAPFIFVSGITDRVGYFDQEVQPREYSQNTVAAHNAGVVVAWILGSLVKLWQ